MMTDLLRKNIVNKKDENKSLKPDLMKEILNELDILYLQLSKSNAHKQFCKSLLDIQDITHSDVRLKDYNELLQIGNIKKNDSVLEIACGFGTFSSWLTDQIQSKIVGVDICQNPLKYAKDKYYDHNQLNFIQANVLKLPFKKSTFNTVYMLQSLSFFNNKTLVECIKNISNVLISRGSFIIWTQLNPEHPIEENTPFLTLNDLSKISNRYNLKIINNVKLDIDKNFYLQKEKIFYELYDFYINEGIQPDSLEAFHKEILWCEKVFDIGVTAHILRFLKK